MHVSRLIGLGIVVTLVAGCDRKSEAASGFVERDSAGIRIVESTRPAWKPEEGWAADSTLITVGTEDGPPEQQLHRVSGAVRLSNGTLVIANAGSGQLLRYDARGQYVGATGGEGDGPGEFRSLSWIGRLRGDSLVTWDRGLNRISVFSPAGEYVREYRPTLPENPMAIEVKGSLSGGRLLMARGASFISAEGVAGVQRQPITAWVMDSTGRMTGSVGPFPGETVFLRSGRQPGSLIRRPVPLGAATLFATGSDAVHVVDTDVFAVRTYSSDGRLSMITRRPYTVLPVQSEDVTAAIDAELENLPPVQSIRDGMRAGFQEIPAPQHLRAIRGVRVDSDDNVWVQVGDRPTATSATWSVFDRKGGWLGDVSLPAPTRLLDIGRDWIVVQDRDELDVERVRVLRLRK